MGRLILTLLGAAALVLAPSPPFHVKAASKIDHRVHQGAVRSLVVEANAGEVRKGYKLIEEVVAFSRQRLGAVPVPSEEGLTNREVNSRAKLHPGSVSPVWMLTKAHDLDEPDSWPPLFSRSDSSAVLLRERDGLDRNQ